MDDKADVAVIEEEDFDDESELETEEREESQENDDSQESDEIIVTIGDESPNPEDEEHAQAPNWVKELRKTHREAQRENRELKEKLAALEKPTQAIELGKKPSLDDFDYDVDEFEAALANWHTKKRQVDELQAAKEAEAQREKQAWTERLATYDEQRKDLRAKVKDYDEAEETVLTTLSQVQQGIIVQGSDNPALVVLALGKSPTRMKELSTITDPVKFAFAVAKLEKDMKVNNRKAPPAPEKTVSGTASKSGAIDSTLERLRAEAEKTGDYSKVVQHKRTKRKA